MTDIKVLREPCIHKRYEQHRWYPPCECPDDWHTECEGVVCPGGKEIRLRKPDRMERQMEVGRLAYPVFVEVTE